MKRINPLILVLSNFGNILVENQSTSKKAVEEPVENLVEEVENYAPTPKKRKRNMQTNLKQYASK